MNQMCVTTKSISKLIAVIAVKMTKIHSAWDVGTVASTKVVIAADLVASSEQCVGKM